MSFIRHALVLSVLLLGCDDESVPEPDPDTGSADGSVDSSAPDVGNDAPADVATDVELDTSVDTATDVPVDVAVDTVIDIGPCGDFMQPCCAADPPCFSVYECCDNVCQMFCE